MRRNALVASLSNLSREQVSLEGKNRRLKAFQPSEGLVCLLLRWGRISHLESNAREQQMREDSFPREC